MLRRLYHIFLRYAEHNLSLDLPGGPLGDSAGRDFGHIEKIALRSNRLTVTGWSTAQRVGLVLGRTRLWTTPDLVQPGSEARGFGFDIPFEASDLAIHLSQGTIHEGDHATVCHFAGVTSGQIARGRLSLVALYIWTLVQLLPTIWRWKRWGDLGAREVVKERLGLVPVSPASVMEGRVLRPASESVKALMAQVACGGVTIVLPVHDAFETLVECLDRIADHTEMNWHLIVIDDQSRDPRVWPMLQSWSAGHADRVTLLRNRVNLGFVQSTNRGLELALRRGVPVVLLNSDALVPKGWAQRLLLPLADTSIATVTPMSNDAEIFTAPVIGARHELRKGEADALDAVARELNPLEGLVEAPTGIGFCMAIAPRYLVQIPQFDLAFGKGYGEETDWCQKVRKMGGRHVCTPALFVEHRGGASFGSVTKQSLLARNGAEISRRYPQYDREVQAFVRNDPATVARLALGLGWVAARQDEVPVYLAHAMGGGADKYLKDRIARDIARGLSSVVLRVGQGHDWKLELHTELGVTQGLSNDLSLVQALIARLPNLRLIYSCGVGARDAATLPRVLLQMAHANGANHPIEILFHDFFPVSPSYTLLGKDGAYRGVPLAAGPLAQDPAHRYSRKGRPDVTLAEWQAAWGDLIAAAQRCVVFTANSAAILAEAYPLAVQKTFVEPHQILHSIPRISPTAEDVPVIGVLGNIGYQKGAALLQKLAYELAQTGRARLVVIGHIDPSWALPSTASVHGCYELCDLPGLVARYGISGWLIPSIWPETFSFTTHETLATGMPVVCFDLGAQGEAVRAARRQGAAATVLPFEPGGSLDIDALLAAIRPD